MRRQLLTAVFAVATLLGVGAADASAACNLTFCVTCEWSGSNFHCFITTDFGSCMCHVLGQGVCDEEGFCWGHE